MVPPTPMARPTRRVEIRMAQGFISLPVPPPPPEHHTQLSGRCDSGSCEAAAFGAGATASDERASSWDSARPFLNWVSDWPSDRDNSGSFFAPKRKTARISATQRSCGPIIDTLHLLADTPSLPGGNSPRGAVDRGCRLRSVTRRRFRRSGERRVRKGRVEPDELYWA